MKQDNTHSTINRYEGTPIEACATAFDYPVIVDGKVMNVNIQGSGTKSIVLLPGRGVTSPSYDFAPLITQLKKHFRVITIDYFGSGLSDMTSSDRTSEAIVQEVHEALSALGVRKYSLLAHSISGVYGLVYANRYTDEIEAFVGIDTAVPGMDKYITPELMAKTTAPTKIDTANTIENDTKEVEGYVYSSNELAIMQKLYDRNHSNEDIFEKIKKEHKRANTKTPYENMQFPDHIPTIFFLSSESVELAPWYVKLHDDQCTTNPKSSVSVLKGQHFLHHNQSKEIATSIIELYR